MKKLLLLLAAVLTAATSMTAQTSMPLPESQTWNYVKKYYMLETLKSEYDCSFRIIGSEEINGKSYQVFSNDGETEKSYIRQEDGKVYMYLTEELRYYYIGETELTRNEVVLYDYSAEEGDTYESISFGEDGFNYWTLAEVTVTSKSMITIAGKDAVCQTLEYSTYKDKEFKAIEGIGISRGRLDHPQCAFLTSGTTFDFFFLTTVTDGSGEVIFDGDRFIDDWSDIDTPTIHSNGIKYHNCILASEGCVITVCDMSGKTVTAGKEEVSCLSLQPGVYVAKTDTHTLKILVK